MAGRATQGEGPGRWRAEAKNANFGEPWPGLRELLELAPRLLAEAAAARRRAGVTRTVEITEPPTDAGTPGEGPEALSVRADAAAVTATYRLDSQPSDDVGVELRWTDGPRGGGCG